MECPYCGGDDVNYVGIDDSGGDYGASICDQWECEDCGQIFETDCIDTE